MNWVKLYGGECLQLSLAPPHLNDLVAVRLVLIPNHECKAVELVYGNAHKAFVARSESLSQASLRFLSLAKGAYYRECRLLRGELPWQAGGLKGASPQKPKGQVRGGGAEPLEDRWRGGGGTFTSNL